MHAKKKTGPVSPPAILDKGRPRRGRAPNRSEGEGGDEGLVAEGLGDAHGVRAAGRVRPHGKVGRGRAARLARRDGGRGGRGRLLGGGTLGCGGDDLKTHRVKGQALRPKGKGKGHAAARRLSGRDRKREPVCPVARRAAGVGGRGDEQVPQRGNGGVGRRGEHADPRQQGQRQVARR